MKLTERLRLRKTQNFNPANLGNSDWVPHGDCDLRVGVKLTVFGR